MITQKIPHRALHISAILLSAFLLCFLAIYNGYPLSFNNDTGTYIETAYSWVVSEDRPVLYGLFIYVASGGLSLWLVVIAQALLLSLTIYYCFRYLIKIRRFLMYYVLFVAMVAFLMSASFEASWIMPDVFTSISVLCVFVLLFGRKLKLRDSILISVMLVVGMGMHNSHFYLCMLLMGLVGFGFVFKCMRTSYGGIGVTWRRCTGIVLLLFGSRLLLGVLHYSLGGEFKSSRGGTVFLMSNAIEMGIVDMYLDEACKDHHYKICPYKDSLPNNFLWNENSPIKKTGGWEANSEEYSAIVNNMLSQPKYLGMFVYQSGLYTVKQFFNFDMAEIAEASERIRWGVSNNYPDEFDQFMRSRENTKRLQVGFLNFAQNSIVALCLVGYMFLLQSKTVGGRNRMLLLFVILALLVNAWLCSTFSGVYPRYQSRVVWMLPLPLFLILAQMYDSNKFRKRTQLPSNYDKQSIGNHHPDALPQ